LADELRFQQELNETLSDSQKMQIRRTLNKTYFKTSYVYSFTSKWKLQAAAAAVVIMILAGGGVMFNYLQNSNPGNLALYEQYFETGNDIFTVRAGESILNNTIEEGMNAYNDKDYLQAIMLFNENSNNMAANLYAGFSFMKLSDFENAEYKFNEIIEDNNNLFIDQAEFNIALCYVATNNLEKAKQMLKVIVKEKTVYSEKAEKLLSNIQ